jgi:hypothetical protein
MTIVTLTTSFTPAETDMPPQARVFIELLADNGGALPIELLCELAADKLTSAQPARAIFNHYNKRLFAANDYVVVSKGDSPAKAPRTTATGLVLAPKAAKPKKERRAPVDGRRNDDVPAVKVFSVAAELAKSLQARLTSRDAVL